MTDPAPHHGHPAPGASDSPPAARWLRALGVTTVTVVVVASVRIHPHPALSGDGLAVTIALVILIASIATVVRRPAGALSATLAPIAMIGASCALVWTQNSGPAVAGAFAAVGYGALRLTPARSLSVLALAAASLAIAALHAQHSAGVIVGTELGVIAFYVLASFARSAQEAHAETARLLAELRATRSAQEEAAALRERSRIAREIHDVLAHALSGLLLQLEGARMLAASPSANGQLPAALDRAHHLAQAGLEEARRAIGALRDDELPGPNRLAKLASEFGRDSSIATTLTTTGRPRELDSQTSLTLFRVAQEALTNTRKHAHPERVELRLSYESDGTRLVIEDHNKRVATVPARAVTAIATPAIAARVDPPEDAESCAGRAGDRAGAAADNPSVSDHGYGLTGMRERAALLGGCLQAGPTEDGFRVQLWIPR